MRIATNMRALNAWRSLSSAGQALGKSLIRLSSGQRINTAADDVSGLAISERMRWATRGLFAAMRNVQDGISLVQTADGALGTIVQLLQRGRELAVQAANEGTMTAEDREALQSELSQVAAEIDHIADSTEFNGMKLLGGNGAKVTALMEGLRRSWLANAESLVLADYGLSADDVALKIVADTGTSGSELAYIQGTPGAGGKWTGLELHINVSAFDNFDLPGGGLAPEYVDRTIAHEMTHAIMARTMDYNSLPKWFREGTAEFTAGADERLSADLARLGSAAGIVGQIDVWNGTSEDYSAGYTAVKYLDSKAAGGIKTVLTALAGGAMLDAAISGATGGAYADAAAFVADYKSAAGGQAYIGTLNLADADVGSVGGGDAQSVVADTNTDTWDPLLHFQEDWAEPENSTEGPGELQVGAEAGQKIALPTLQVSTYDLGIGTADLEHHAAAAISSFNDAIVKVGVMRSRLGALQNRLEHAYNVDAAARENMSASESRIRDADMAREMTDLTRHQLLVQSATAMTAQANGLLRSNIAAVLG